MPDLVPPDFAPGPDFASVPDFVPPDFVVPDALIADQFHLTPLGPEHYSAWTTSAERSRATPGVADRSWPREIALAENLGDLLRHEADFSACRGFTYTVLSPREEVIGCVYVYPSEARGFDVQVRSWVRADHAHLYRALHHAVRLWLSQHWPFTAVDYALRMGPES